MKKLFIISAILLIALSGFTQNIFVVTKNTDPNPFSDPYNNIDSLCDPDMYGTLQWAIRKANDAVSPSRIEFNIPGTGINEIELQSFLPQIIKPVELDATSQPGYQPGNCAIKINGQGKFKSCFEIYNATVSISGFEITGFVTNAIWLNSSPNSLILNNKVILSSNSSIFSYAIGFAMSDNVTVKGNIISNVQTSDSINSYYGMYIKYSNYGVIGDTTTDGANHISNCVAGILLAQSQNVKISGNSIFNNNTAILLMNGSNNNILPPVILSYANGILSGTAEPNSTIEIFGSTGPENANEYLASTVADGNGLFEKEYNTEYEYFAITQRDLYANTSGLSWIKQEKACDYPIAAIDDNGNHITIETESWTIEGNPFDFTALHLTICENTSPFYIYDETSAQSISAGFDPPGTPVFWYGDCLTWAYSTWDGYDYNSCVSWDEESEIEPFWHDLYGYTIQFDPSAYGVGEHTINLQYGSICYISRVFITILPTPDATITPVDPICINAHYINLSAATPGGIWSGIGIIDATNGIFNPQLAGEGTHEIIYTVNNNDCPGADTIFIEVLPAPVVNAYNNGPVCEGEDVSFWSIGSSNIETYHWVGPFPFQSSSQDFIHYDVNSSMAGAYMVTVTDNNGCTNQAETVLDIHPDPFVTINPQAPVICNLEPVELCVEGLWGEVLWNTNETLPCIWTDNANQVYTVSVTDQHGCTASTSVTTVASAIIIKDPMVTNTCLGANDGSISFLIAGGQAPLTIEWTGPNGYTSNQQNISNLFAGIYTVTITDALGCSIIEEFEVEAGLTPLLETNANHVCNGAATGEASVIILNDTGDQYTIIWSNGETTANISEQLPATYTVTVTDEAGCSAQASATIEDYIVNAAFSFNSDCIDLDRIGVPWYFNMHFDFEYDVIDWENYNFYWDLGNGTTSTEMTVPLDYTMDGYYCVSTVVSREECISTSSDMVYVNPNRCFCMESTFSPGFYEDYTVNSAGEDWISIERNIRGKIIVPSGATLNILDCKLYFGTLGGIVVEQGAKLYVSKTLMTSLNRGPECNAMWQGIEVHGQWNLPVEQQGNVYLMGGNTIENAHIGVLLGERNLDYVCNPDIDAELGPFNTQASCGWVKAKDVSFKNNGTDIRFIKPVGNNHYQNPSSVTHCDFISTILLDECYNSAHPSHYGLVSPPWMLSNLVNTRNPWAGGSNPTQRSPQSIWMQKQTINSVFNLNDFENKEICIESFDSKYNVAKCNFLNAIFGIRVMTTLNSANYAHKFYQNTFDKIPGIAGSTGAHIYIQGGILDRVRDNTFGFPNSSQNLSNTGVYATGASRFIIEENDFNRLKIGVLVGNSGTNSSDVRAGDSNVHDDWRGNNFYRCKTNIYTRGLNARLRLRCNNCKNDLLSQHYVNFDNQGVLANQGTYSILSAPMATWGAGNEFYDQEDFPSDQSRYLKSNSTYRYVYHSNAKTTPKLFSGTVLNLQPLYLSKPLNTLACPVLSIPFTLPISEVPAIEDILPIRPDILNEIDYLEQLRTNLKNNEDGGKTQELLDDINNHIPNGELKNKLIANSPLSDTVITALLIEYPLSHGNFKNVMEINMPVSPTVEPYLFARLETLPQGIRQQLKPLQSFNPNVNTVSSTTRYIDYLTQERELLVNEILMIFTDTAYYNPEYIKQILAAENNPQFDMNLAAFLIDAGNYSDAIQIINDIEPVNKETSDWIDYHQILLSLFNNNKTIYQMDSTQLAFITDLAYACPSNYTTSNAQAVLHLLYGTEFEECEEMLNRRSFSLIKDVVFTVPETDAWVEDNFPNPFTDETLINYYLPEKSTGSIVVTDMYGREIAFFNLASGENTLIIKSDAWAPGVYYYSFIVDGKSLEHKKMIITQ